MPPKKRILAIDDDASICDFYSQGLALLGFDISCASNAKKARDFLKTQKPDLILMDIMMPDVDGITLTREFRADTKTADIPILVVSGLADAGTLNDALLFGAVDYMVKPIDLDALKAKIDRTFAALERRRKPA
ncbi:MAG: response regulator [Elusimicrobia bacterium]|nr:response regulator [Elusimicrobiota bacterium]